MIIPNPFRIYVQRDNDHLQRAEKMKQAWITFCDKLEMIKRKAKDNKQNL